MSKKKKKSAKKRNPAKKAAAELSIEQLITEETTVRLAEMSKPDYEFPEKATKTDAILIAGGIVICVALIILCMTGVIV